MVGSAECSLLAVMAYDRYVAVCLPLRYLVLMNWKACCLMALASWMGGVADSVIDVGMVFSFPYCDSLQVDHFFCEVPAVLRLSCAPQHVGSSQATDQTCGPCIGRWILNH